ncbi:Tetratricopeptide TPR_2 [Rubrobacter xylanophilus DSM 9941]|uniref:Tetratricopeptide TPR_2 n=1 Tax=Rubrobacter xylanophilus (strain DSM 9941 / JCM 11954 / NBRC 16129 / PRD-1) TaxID=266117 RepID=Q1AXQ6_RUBXD|nr:hypothetical protein [Rubrobacter xylanophilus]ABG03822.1 Tetratricopeptide TPR_2 [Rubrobacter xylanophilus DSM 9941]
MEPRREAAEFLAGLAPRERALFSRLSGVALPAAPAGIERALAGAPAGAVALLATAAARAAGEEPGLARRLGEAALRLARDRGERQLAHVCLAQVHFARRRNPEELAAFERHCRRAIELGHAGTFCYERLAALYEYQGRYGEALRVCERAVEALAGDALSARRFRSRAERLRRKASGG